MQRFERLETKRSITTSVAEVSKPDYSQLKLYSLALFSILELVSQQAEAYKQAYSDKIREYKDVYVDKVSLFRQKAERILELQLRERIALIQDFIEYVYNLPDSLKALILQEIFKIDNWIDNAEIMGIVKRSGFLSLDIENEELYLNNYPLADFSHKPEVFSLLHLLALRPETSFQILKNHIAQTSNIPVEQLTNARVIQALQRLEQFLDENQIYIQLYYFEDGLDIAFLKSEVAFCLPYRLYQDNGGVLEFENTTMLLPDDIYTFLDTLRTQAAGANREKGLTAEELITALKTKLPYIADRPTLQRFFDKVSSYLEMNNCDGLMRTWLQGTTPIYLIHERYQEVKE